MPTPKQPTIIDHLLAVALWLAVIFLLWALVGCTVHLHYHAPVKQIVDDRQDADEIAREATNEIEGFINP